MYVCIYLYTHMYLCITLFCTSCTNILVQHFLQSLICTNFQPIEVSHASKTQPLSCMSDAPTRHLRPMLQDFIDKLVTQISNIVNMRKCWPECTDISELPNMMESKHGRTALRPGMEKLNRVWKMLWDSIFRRLHRNTNQDLFTSAKHQLLASMLHSSWLSGHGTKLPIWFSKAMIATDLEDDGRAWNQSKQPKFLATKSWFLIFQYLDLLAPAPDVGTLSTHVGTSNEMKSRPEVMNLMATSKHWQIPWRLYFSSREHLGRCFFEASKSLEDEVNLISLHERSMSRNESRCISRLFATKLWLSKLRAFWFLFWETWELSTKKAGLLYSVVQVWKDPKVRKRGFFFERRND